MSDSAAASAAPAAAPAAHPREVMRTVLRPRRTDTAGGDPPYADARTDPHIGKSGQAGDERLPADVQMHERFAAQGFDHQDVAVPDPLVDRAQADVFRADPELQLSLVR